MDKIYLHLRRQDQEETQAANERGRQKRCAWQQLRHSLLRAEVLAHYGNKCACCGETHPEFLGIDHINGGGNKHRREPGVGSGAGFYLWLKKHHYPEGFQVLCHNCNLAKGFYGYCPHKKLATIPQEH
jgi:hypothetical protein